MRTVCNKINNHIIRHELMYDVQMLEANKEVFLILKCSHQLNTENTMYIYNMQ